MPSIFDLLEQAEKEQEEEEKQRKIEAEEAARNAAANGSADDENNGTSPGQEWLDSTSSKVDEIAKKKTDDLRAVQWDTKVRPVEVRRLVWVKFSGFKGGSFHWPGRVADNAEGACVKLRMWPIPADHVLVEFICMLKKNPEQPRFEIFKTSEVLPFNARCKKSSIALFASEQQDEEEDCPNRWDPGHMNILGLSIRGKFKIEGKRIFNKVKDTAVQFLKGAVDYNTPAPAADAPVEDDDDDDSYGMNNGYEALTDDGEEAVDLLQFAHKGRGQREARDETITAGRWVQYQHKVSVDWATLCASRPRLPLSPLTNCPPPPPSASPSLSVISPRPQIFKDRTICTRVIAVVPGDRDEPLKLETDDVLAPSQYIMVRDRSPVCRYFP
jgi:hypothetical protein